MLLTWVLTVASEMTRRSAISRFASPSPMRRSTSVSRAVRPGTSGLDVDLLGLAVSPGVRQRLLSDAIKGRPGVRGECLFLAMDDDVDVAAGVLAKLFDQLAQGAQASRSRRLAAQGIDLELQRGFNASTQGWRWHGWNLRPCVHPGGDSVGSSIQ